MLAERLGVFVVIFPSAVSPLPLVAASPGDPDRPFLRQDYHRHYQAAMQRSLLNLCQPLLLLLLCLALLQVPGATGNPRAGGKALKGSSLTAFCQSRPSGLYCHPHKGSLQVYCPSEESPTIEPLEIACPSKHICRSHRKLHFTSASGEGAAADSSQKNPLDSKLQLHGIESPSLSVEDDHLVVQYPQCVPEDKSDLDAFCEDKIHEFVAGHPRSSSHTGGGLDMPSHLNSLRQRYSALLSAASSSEAQQSSDSTGPNAGGEPPLEEWDEVVLAVRQCNPFNALRKQVLDCVVVQRECGIDLAQVFAGDENAKLPDQTCIPTKEIKLYLEDCPTFDVCRKYEREEGSELSMAKCIPPVDAMCQDQFWSIYADDLLQEQEAVEDPVAVQQSIQQSPDAQLIQESSLQFRFCDPFQSRQQLQCAMRIRIHRKPALSPRTILNEDDRRGLIQRLRSVFPSLYQTLTVSKSSYRGIGVDTTLSIKQIQVKRHVCPAETVRHGERTLEVPKGYVDPWLVYEGPVCKQLTQKVARCLPRSMLDVPREPATAPAKTSTGSARKIAPAPAAAISSTDAEVESIASPPSEVASTAQPAPVLHAESEMGYCMSQSTPGQYCVPGTPEIAILCPQGKTITCPRPAPVDHASWTDVGGESLRCVQRFGDIPGQAGHAPLKQWDPLRKVKVLDLFGNELSSGYWAQCVRGVDVQTEEVAKEQQAVSDSGDKHEKGV